MGERDGAAPIRLLDFKVPYPHPYPVHPTVFFEVGHAAQSMLTQPCTAVLWSVVQPL